MEITIEEEDKIIAYFLRKLGDCYHVSQEETDCDDCLKKYLHEAMFYVKTRKELE